MNVDIVELLKKPLSSVILLTSVSAGVLYFYEGAEPFFLILFSVLVSDGLLNSIISGGGGHARVVGNNQFISKGHAVCYYFIAVIFISYFVEVFGREVFAFISMYLTNGERALGLGFAMSVFLYLKVDQLFYKRNR